MAAGFFTIWNIAPSPAHSAKEADALILKAEVDKAFVTIGDRIEYRIVITRDPAIQVLDPIAPPSSEAFEIKEAHDFSEKQGKTIVEGRRFILTAYQLGEYVLEPVRLHFRTPAGEEKITQTQPLYLTVQSVDSSGKPKTDIRGPKEVVSLPRRWPWTIVSILSGLLVAGFYFWWRSERRATQEGENEPPVSPEDEALLRLSQLFDSDLLRRGKLKEHFLQLSEILQRFFERRFEILALEPTTSEILRELRHKEITVGLLAKIQTLLESADLVKFAKWVPPHTEILQMNQKAKAIVEESRPPVPVSPVHENPL